MTIATREVSATLSFTPTVDDPSSIIYSQGFESFADHTTNPDGWAITSAPAGSPSAVLYVEAPGSPHSGSNDAKLNSGTIPGTAGVAGTYVISRTFSGLVIGRAYSAAAWVSTAASTTATLGVTGLGSGASSTGSTGYRQIRHTFTATATSHTVTLTFVTGAGWGALSVAWVDDVTLAHADVDLDVREGSVTLDEGWAPYGKADLTIAMPSAYVLDLLDPRDSPRITVHAESYPVGLASSSRDWNLGLRERAIDHNAATVRLSLATDEALLQDAANTSAANDTSALVVQSSVRSIVNSVVLAKIGAALEAGTADADFTTLTSVTNLVPNPSFETGTTGWVLGSGTAAIVQSNTFAYAGTYSLRWQSNTTTASTANGPGFAVTAGKTYTFSCWVRSSVARAMRILCRWYTASGGTQIGGDSFSATVTDTTTGWTRLTFTGTAPATATWMYYFIQSTAGVSGDLHYVDGIMAVEGNGFDTDGVTPLAYFDGATADTSRYNYDWTGTAHASSSTRTPVFQRDPQTLSWEPGESAYDFIRPVLDQAGLRLFCDEARKWRLVDSTYSVPGRVTVAEGFNAYQASDTISRDAKADDGTPLWFNAVVVKYTWNDTNNVQQVRYDVANDGSPTQTALIEYARPYPGPGAAAYILSRVNGQGRTLDLAAAIDYAATPGMEVSASLPVTPVQTGYTSSVTWDFTADEMRVGSRGLIDTPANSWYFTTGAWSSQSSTWAAATT